MTVLVLDSPELIARAAAMEAAQANGEVKAEETRSVYADAQVSAPGQLACLSENDSLPEPQEESLALVM
ncbi:hypothetical protein ACFOZ5_13085 [Marinobacter lacisalsi]|uniref:Uncharacterized protein n=1 Tax=Marinobacter lacisalsi TaxID=475979 RepID=A0ABV8QJN9_9GAMM